VSCPAPSLHNIYTVLLCKPMTSGFIIIFILYLSPYMYSLVNSLGQVVRLGMRFMWVPMIKLQTPMTFTTALSVNTDILCIYLVVNLVELLLW